MSSLKSLVVCVVVALAAGASAHCNQIQGQVYDQSGKAIQGVTVCIEGSGFMAKTNSQGSYSLDYVPGAFNVVFTKKGYISQSVPRNIAQKSHYPMAQINLKKVPKVVDIFGQPIQDADIGVKDFYGGGRRLGTTDADGYYSLDQLPEVCMLVFGKTGYKVSTLELPGQFPEEITLCPEMSGVYTGDDQYIPATMFQKQYGVYSFDVQPPAINGQGQMLFYIYPKTPVANDWGYQQKTKLVLVKVDQNGKFWQVSNESYSYQRVHCNFSSEVERTIKKTSRGLVNQSFKIYRTEVYLQSGNYAFCEVAQGNKYPAGHTAFYFSVGGSPGYTTQANNNGNGWHIAPSHTKTVAYNR